MGGNFHADLATSAVAAAAAEDTVDVEVMWSRDADTFATMQLVAQHD